MKNIGAVVLAAGLSSRMGDFKPLLPVGGQSMAARVVGLMRAAGAQPVVVVTGHRAAELQQHLAASGAEFVFNPAYAQTQMFASVCLGLQAVAGRCERVLLSPADIPLAKPETAKALLASRAGMARPVHGGAPGHPVLLSAALIPAILAYQGEGGLRGAIQHCGVGIEDVAVNDPGILVDGDTPEDYTRLLRMAQGEATR